MKVDTADSKGKWLVRTHPSEAVDSRSRPGVPTSLARVRGESARGRRSVAEVAKSCEVNSTIGRPKNPSGTGEFEGLRSLKLVARGRIELPTYGFSDRRSSN